MEPQLIADYGCKTGEGPLWHPDEKRVYWTDIPTGRLFRYEPLTGKHEQFYEGQQVGGFTIQEDGSLLRRLPSSLVLREDLLLLELPAKVSQIQRRSRLKL